MSHVRVSSLKTQRIYCWFRTAALTEINGSEPRVRLQPAEINAIIDYAQRKFAEERFRTGPATGCARRWLS